VHILAAIVWVGGALITQVYAVRVQADSDPERLIGFARDVEFVGKTMFTPASLVLVVFGFLLVNEGNWDLGQTWLIFALIVFAASFAVGVGFLAPESGRIARALEEFGPTSGEAQRRINRIFLVSRIELLFLLLVVVDMVVKPGL
jgi:uncharacterized membrane protein